MLSETHSIKRLNATLPEPLARFVGEMTGEGGLYETPSEFIRDLIRRHMEKMMAAEQATVNNLLRQSMAEKDYTLLTDADGQKIRDAVL